MVDTKYLLFVLWSKPIIGHIYVYHTALFNQFAATSAWTDKDITVVFTCDFLLLTSKLRIGMLYSNVLQARKSNINFDMNDASMIVALRIVYVLNMDLFPDTHNCGLRMRQECRERFPRHRFQRKPLISDPALHHGTCVTHVPWCMSGSLACGGGENVPGIPGARATRNFPYLVRGPCSQ